MPNRRSFISLLISLPLTIKFIRESPRWSIPIVCEEPGCINQGKEINRIIDLRSEEEAVSALEDTHRYSADDCPVCGYMGIKQEPEYGPIRQKFDHRIDQDVGCCNN